MKRSAAPSLKIGYVKKPLKFVSPCRLPPDSEGSETSDVNTRNYKSDNQYLAVKAVPLKAKGGFVSPLLQVKSAEVNGSDVAASISLNTTTEPSVHVVYETNRNNTKPVATKFHAPLQQRSGNISHCATPQSTPTDSVVSKRYLSAVWCKRSSKKHKNWEGDAILIVGERSVSLLDTDGKEIGKACGYKHCELSSLKEGETLFVGSKEIEVMGTITEENFLSGKCFAGNTTAPVISQPISKISSLPKKTVTGAGLFINKSDASAVCTARELKPRFDPSAPNAVVLSRPPPGFIPKGTTVVDVVVDPHVSHHLRPHQREGINFIYECVMGYKDIGGLGAILADEMGLGKTLQVISLLWTLFKQNPTSHKPVIRRALVVTPGSLVKNWVKEFKKWLGQERLNVFAVSSDKKAEEFKNASVYPVMVVSYEMFVRYCDEIKQSNFDLLICDEGHRLKNSTIKTTSLLQSVNTRRRVVVTGTPIQNDLKEFFTLVDFCNPGLLGNQSSFHKVYEDPILKSKQPNCTAEEKKVGEERAKELNRVTSSFILRRTSDINQQYLPQKTEYVVFCKPSPLQINMYRKLLGSSQLTSLLNYSGDGSLHLTCINHLKQICNHPSLMSQQNDNVQKDDAVDAHATVDISVSGKLKVVSQLLRNFHSKSGAVERIILVSNYTKTLDLLESLCKQNGYTFLRLDGKTPVQRRQQLVDLFNSSFSTYTVFLLSSKAGGVGLNLIGANRLILYDIDWNPANDLQAMARIWRDGQKKAVYIYRLLTTGTIEEKIYQRQVTKQVLGNSVVDSVKESEVKFSQDDLRDLFTFRPDTMCDTHDMLMCKCLQQSVATDSLSVQNASSRSKNVKQLCMSELATWKHLTPSDIDNKVEDSLIHKATADISFMFASAVVTQEVNPQKT